QVKSRSLNGGDFSFLSVARGSRMDLSDGCIGDVRWLRRPPRRRRPTPIEGSAVVPLPARRLPLAPTLSPRGRGRTKGAPETPPYSTPACQKSGSPLAGLGSACGPPSCTSSSGRLHRHSLPFASRVPIFRDAALGV